MIKEEKVSVKIGPRNIKYFNMCGYDVTLINKTLNVYHYLINQIYYILNLIYNKNNSIK